MPTKCIPIGPVPWGETCVQVGTAGYEDRAMLECEVFRRMLLRLFPVPEGVNVRLRVKGSDHDFGTYYEVVAVVNDDDQRAIDYAMAVEHGHPERWDAVALAEMLWFEERAALLRRIAAGKATQLPELYRRATPPDGLTIQQIVTTCRQAV